MVLLTGGCNRDISAGNSHIYWNVREFRGIINVDRLNKMNKCAMTGLIEEWKFKFTHTHTHTDIYMGVCVCARARAIVTICYKAT